MKRLPLAACVLAAFAGCTEPTSYERMAREVENQLIWVDAANPQRLFEADEVSGRIRFLAVCGYACQVPAVGERNAKKCFPNVPIEIIAGTSDALVSKRHKELQARAWKVAEEYNALVAKSQQRAGKDNCKPREQA